MKTLEVQNIVKKHAGKAGGLLGILQEIQVRYGYLPQEALRIVSESMGRPLVDVYGVATFYRSFSLKPRGKHLCSVCLGTACHVRGAPKIYGEFKNHLGIEAGQTTPDREFTLETVNCLGACALGPVVVVDGRYFPGVNSTQVEEVIEQTRHGLDVELIRGDERVFPVEVSCHQCNHSLMDPGYLLDGYPSIRVTVSFRRKHGWLRLSSLYGSHRVESEYEIPLNEVVSFFCPHCHAELTGPTVCAVCGAAMVQMIVRGGGTVQICSRHGCKGHLLDVA